MEINAALAAGVRFEDSIKVPLNQRASPLLTSNDPQPPHTFNPISRISSTPLLFIATPSLSLKSNRIWPSTIWS
jgi:hypothetical protein